MLQSRRLRFGFYAAVALAAAAFIYFLWIVLGPGPMHFAGGKRVPIGTFGGADPTGVPKELTQTSVVERGRYLARAADCEACHTAKSGIPYSGGRAFVLPFGTLYSTNITPDAETGIGNYSDTDFLKVLHKGIGPDGQRLFPAMPYASYTYMSDADALAIKAYLFSLRPIRLAQAQSSLRFPFNQRWLMGIWALVFNPDKRFEPDAQRDAQWNRGAYLAEAMAHCGECHTPRNLFQALDNRAKFSGAAQAGWRAYNITADRSSGLGEWSDADIANYLSAGHADGHGTAAGPMGEAVDASFRYLTQPDVAAIVAYLRTVPPVATNELPRLNARIAPSSPQEGAAAQVSPLGKAVFEGACASCHGWSGVSPVMAVATLTGVRAVNDPTAVNVVQVIISGAPGHADMDITSMPAFGDAYSDEEIASVANYVTARFGAQSSAMTAERVAKLRAAD